MNLFIQRFGGDKILEYFDKVLDTKEDTVVIGAALELLSTKLIKASSQYFKEKLNIKKIIKRIGKILFEFSSDKEISMPALGSLLALRDIEKRRTIKAIIKLPSHQLEIIRDLSDSYAPDLSSNLNSTSESDVTHKKSNNSSRYSNNDIGLRKFKSEDVEMKPSEVYSHYPDVKEKPKTTPYFTEYDQVPSNKEPTVYMSSLKESTSQGLEQREYDDNDLHDFSEEIENDQCIDCVSYFRKMANGKDSIGNIHKINANSKPYYIHILIDHYSDEETIFQIVDDLVDAEDGSQNAMELLMILSELIVREEPPILQALIKIEKYIISKCSNYELTHNLKEITEPLISTFSHPHANVRKSVVFCLVELYFTIGDSFESCLEELNPSQQKLV